MTDLATVPNQHSVDALCALVFSHDMVEDHSTGILGGLTMLVGAGVPEAMIARWVESTDYPLDEADRVLALAREMSGRMGAKGG